MARDLTGTIQLRQAQKMEAIGRLAAGIAHEINTPIQFTEHNLQFLQDSFKAFAEALGFYEQLLAAARSGAISQELIAEVADGVEKADLGYLAREVPKALQEALHGTERVAKIVGAMKEFSHPGTRRCEKAEPMDLRRAIESTITVARNEWKYVAELVTEFEAAMPPVPLYAGEFNQVILNLLVNAAHAISDATEGGTRGKGAITVTVRQNSPWAEVLIRDTGTGIPEKVRHRVFEPFFTTKEIGKGTGQGLALARSVIEKHQGTLSFESEMGKGTCFLIRLPFGTRPSPVKDDVAKRQPALA
jgi:signal transduction histidine kinase